LKDDKEEKDDKGGKKDKHYDVLKDVQDEKAVKRTDVTLS